MKTVFLRALSANDKAEALLERVGAVRAAASHPDVFAIDSDAFHQIPRAPFAYWARQPIRDVFSRCVAFNSEGRESVVGLKTSDDARFVRLKWEVSSNSGQVWRTFVKGGNFSRFYRDQVLRANWRGEGAELWAYYERNSARTGGMIKNPSYYFRPGLTWTPRTQKGFGMAAMPRGCIFGNKGPAAFVADDDSESLLPILAITNSSPFSYLISLQMAFGSFEVGTILHTPVPSLSEDQGRELGELARQAWRLTRTLDAGNECSEAFVLPSPMLEVYLDRGRHSIEEQLASLQDEIDLRVAGLYTLSVADFADRQGIEDTSVVDEAARDGSDEGDGARDDEEGSGVVCGPSALLSWSVGVAFGRFDVRLANGERGLLVEPDPFAPLPICSLGMLASDDALRVATPPSGYPLAFPADGVLVDDPGAARDVLDVVRKVFGVVFGDAGDERLIDVVGLLDPSADDLRRWLRSTFFTEHIQRYSKSRRKAPIYWRLGTPSGCYSVWLYLHRTGPDTLHAVLRDHVEPKLRYEEDRWHGLSADAGPTPSTSQRKELASQEALVDELRAFRDELVRVAPLWNPDLDDGVVINASFLHRLFLHTKPWAKECESHWEKLKAGEYDWAHLAMRLWPERVAPKCAEDRSLAIAHGLEDVFWAEGDDGKWSTRDVDEATIQRLVVERTSAAVKAALREVSAAPPPARGVRPAPAAKAPRERRASEPVAQLPLDLGGPRARAEKPALDALRAALHQFPEGAGRSELLAASGLDEAQWMPAITELVESGEVERAGQKRGTRYMLRAGGTP